jgi:hypothetical protein
MEEEDEWSHKTASVKTPCEGKPIETVIFTTIRQIKTGISLYIYAWLKMGVFAIQQQRVQEVRWGKFGREAEAGCSCSPFEVCCLSADRENLSRPYGEEARRSVLPVACPLETYSSLI